MYQYLNIDYSTQLLLSKATSFAGYLQIIFEYESFIYVNYTKVSLKV